MRYTLSHLWIEYLTRSGDGNALIRMGVADCLLVRWTFSTTVYNIVQTQIHAHSFLLLFLIALGSQAMLHKAYSTSWVKNVRDG